jgi:hypothetical protein
MIKTLLLSTLYSVLRSYLGSGVYDRIASQVLMLMNSDEPGAQKMSRVFEFAKTEAFIIQDYLLRAVVELVLYRASLASK